MLCCGAWSACAPLGLAELAVDYDIDADKAGVFAKEVSECTLSACPPTHVHGCFMRVANGEPVILEYRAHGRGSSDPRLCMLMQPRDPSLELPAHTRVWAVTERWGRGQGPVSARSLSRPLAPRWYAPAFLGPFWVETRLGHLFHDDMHPRRRPTAGRAPRRRDRQPVRLGRFQP